MSLSPASKRRPRARAAATPRTPRTLLTLSLPRIEHKALVRLAAHAGLKPASYAREVVLLHLDQLLARDAMESARATTT